MKNISIKKMCQGIKYYSIQYKIPTFFKSELQKKFYEDKFGKTNIDLKKTWKMTS